MKKPSTRKERMALIEQKHGRFIVESMYELTDKEIKRFFDLLWNRGLPEMPDYIYSDEPVICLKCKKEVIIEHNHYCDCGKNEAVLNEDELK
jgi:hypothetical protein